MRLGSINLVVKDPEQALRTWLQVIGTNNVESVIRIGGMNDTTEVVGGYYLKTSPIMLGLFSPVSSTGRMAEHLARYGEGIHHIELHVGQDEFSRLHRSFQELGWPVSREPIFLGRLGEAVFWLEESGEHGVPVKFSTKTYHGFGKSGAVYLDTPKQVEKVAPEHEWLRPRVLLVTAVIATKAQEQFERLHSVWATILSQPEPVRTLDAATQDRMLVDDGRGDLFWPSSFLLQGHAKLSIYHAVNEDGPIQKVLAKRGRNALFHNLIFLVTRDRVHDYWQQLEAAGFNMVDPKPLLLGSTGNYFFFVHPASTCGVASEFVAATKLNPETGEFEFDWSDTELNIVPPELNGARNLEEKGT